MAEDKKEVGRAASRTGSHASHDTPTDCRPSGFDPSRKANLILRRIVEATHSHIDGRDLLGELHPRRMLDIKRRVDGVETWFEGDWLSTLYDAVKLAKVHLWEVDRMAASAMSGSAQDPQGLDPKGASAAREAGGAQ